MDTLDKLDYHVASRISNAEYKIEVAIHDLIEIGLGVQEIRDLVTELLDQIER